MKVLMSRLKEDAKKRGITNSFLAEKLGRKAPMMSNIFNGKYRMGFDEFVHLAALIYENNFKISNQIIVEFGFKTDKLNNLKEACEWGFNNGYIELVEYIVEKNRDRDLFFKCYELFLMRSKGLSNTQLFFNSLEAIQQIINRSNGISPEVKTLTCLLNIYLHADNKSYELLSYISEKGLQYIKEIDSGYLAQSYELKILASQAMSAKNKKDLYTAAMTAFKVIEKSEKSDFYFMLASSYNLLSEIYVFEDYEKSINFNKKALEYFDCLDNNNFKRQKQILKSTHDFIKIHNGIYTDLYLEDPAEAAHYLVKLGGDKNNKKAMDILDFIEKNNKGLTSFQLYYKYCATNTKEVLMKCLFSFSEDGDMHYLTLLENMNI